ncbi:MAG: serine/threonine protein kinase [Thermoanaerobaculia bacterium]|nr:serine/threonine protein kinase [Thermoanaerobaculia bacterium]
MAVLGSGAILGRYRLEERIGAGGMAEVWRALDLGLERNVALKVMSPEAVSGDASFVPRFLREAKLSARLEHPHVLPIYDFGQVDDLLFLVMPLLPGGTLRDRAREGVSAILAMEWLKALASALDYAHGEGIVHRDVKPANVLFDRTGRLFLADFGLARAAGSASLTVAGTVLGTPVYMSPEQVRGEAAGPRSDQYALGVLAYYLLAGTPPFEANSVFVVMEKTLRDEPALPSEVNPGLHRSADYVLLKVLEKRPSDRFESCGAFVQALERASRRGTDPGSHP